MVDLFPSVPPEMAWLCGQGPFTHTTDQMRLVLDAAAPRLRTGPARPFALRGAMLHAPTSGEWPDFVADVLPHVREAVGGEVLGRAPLPADRHTRDVYAGLWSSMLEDLVASDPELTFGEGLRAVISSLVLRGRLGDRRIPPSTAELLALMALGRVTIYRDRRRVFARAHAIRDAVAESWDRGYLVVMPVCAFPPPRTGRSNRNLKLLDCTVPGNLADATGLAIPFDTFRGYLPRALQLLGPPGSERLLLDVADRLVVSRDADPACRPAALAV